jgi:peptidyl-prolyl cis-trans isomerase C
VIADAPPVDYETTAHEKYLVNPDVWRSEERIDVSHILISSENRSNETAGKLAAELWEELEVEPSRFDAMVEEYSEDPSKAVNGGRFPQVKRDDMVKPFEEAAFALDGPGAISLPVETAYGYHIIRLNRKLPGTVPPFEDIKAQAMGQARETYLKDYSTRYLRQTLSDPIELPDGAVEEMAKRYFGENLELAPDFSE